MIKQICIIVLLLIFRAPGSLPAAEYHIDKSKENLVKFISDAPIENFEGVTDKIDGYLIWQDDDPMQGSDIYLEVDLNTLDTGIGLRNRHMRENYLETDKYPFTYFKGKLVSVTKSDSGYLKLEADGKIFIHGIEQPLTVKGKWTPVADGFRFTCDFIVKLSDFKIEIPSIMFYKINENMDLKLDFYMLPAK